MAETAAGGGSDDDSDQLVSIHEAAENCNVNQLQRALAAGVSPNITSFANYERQHFDRLTGMLTPRHGPSSPLRRVPPEVLRKIAAFAFHVGYY